MKKRYRNISAKIKKAIVFLNKDIWKPTQEKNSFFIRHLRIVLLALRAFEEDEVIMRASALTYFTLLSIVPIAGLAFGIAKAFGMESYMEMQLEMALAGREEVYEWIMGFSQSMLQAASGGMVAGVGIIILLYTIMRLLVIMEESFNEIWQIKKARPWMRRFSEYFSLMFLAPLFFLMSSTVTVYLNTQATSLLEGSMMLGLVGSGMLFVLNLIPLFLVWIMLTLLYMIMPFTNVKFSSALFAGMIAGTMFQLVQWGYIYFQIGVSQYNAIYGSFAALPLLLMWVQVSWLVVLFGGELSYIYQNIDNFEFDAESTDINPFSKKILSLYIMQQVVENFRDAQKPLDTGTLANQLVMPFKLVQSAINDLIEVGLLNEIRVAESKETAYQPAMDINSITIQNVIDSLEHQGSEIQVLLQTPKLKAIHESLDAFSKLIGQSEKNMLLKDIS